MTAVEAAVTQVAASAFILCSVPPRPAAPAPLDDLFDGA
jgi:hypothetical protein